MRRLFVAAALAAVASTTAMRPALSQTPAPQAPAATKPAPAPAQTPGNSAVNTPGQNNAAQPVAGSNSFTEGQARARIEAAGYAAVTGLALDAQGVWRGQASRDGKQTDVTLDFQGNVNPR